MDLGLQDKIAFVAGASSGLGLAAAIELAREGCRVAICSRDENHIHDAAQTLRREAGVEAGRVLPLVCDVTDETQIEAALARTVEAFGGLNILVTNAGGPPSGPLEGFDAEAWRRGLELNLMSTINLCRHALAALRSAAKNTGLARIIMVTSVSAKQPVPGLALSSTARAGVQGFAKSLSEELGPDGVTVNTLLPGYTRTERLGELSDAIHGRTGTPIPEIEAGWAAATALGRLGEPSEFAAAVAFLASARAGYITGIAFPVDGGRIKHLL